MREIQISACQFRLERYKSFNDFKKQVEELLSDVPLSSDYVIFPELFTISLLTSYPNAEKLSLEELLSENIAHIDEFIDRFTPDYRSLFFKVAAQRKQLIIGGSHLECERGKYYNICHIFTPDGKEFKHKKSHLFPMEASLFHIAEGDDLEVYALGPAKFGIATCYEAEIPEISRILAVNGADIIFCPSYTISEAGFWRVRHCAQARCIENQIYFVHCCTVGEPGPPLSPLLNGFGRSSILSPCDTPWTPNGIVVEAETNKNTVITGKVDLDALYENRERGAAPTFRDRTRRTEVYRKYKPYMG